MNALRRFGYVLGSLVLVGCAGPAAAVSSASLESTENLAAGRMGSHGMIVAGTPGAAFLSHIPMFGAPHDVQALVAGSFVGLENGRPLPSSFADQLFTFLPDAMSLDALRTGALHELTGTLFLGNFEAGGRPVPGRVRFDVARVLHQHVLAEDAAPSAETSYFLFGSRQDAFAVHRLTRAPGFDEVLRVRLTGDVPTDAELAEGVEATLSGRVDQVADRLGKRPATAVAGSRTFTVETETELSCLEGPDFVSACP